MAIKTFNVAIVGATGLVGKKITQLLADRQFPINKISLLSSERSAGENLVVGERTVIVEEATVESFKNVDIAFFSAGGDVSKLLAKKAVNAGAIVIDNTSAFRMAENVPLVVPEVNAEALNNHEGIISNPNCSTIQMVIALAPIKQAFGLQRIIVSTYQSVSGAGRQAIDDLFNQVDQFMKRESELMKSPINKHQIAFNLIPQIDCFEASGYTAEEMKMVNETKKIFSDDSLAIAATCVRVPVLTSHSESIYVEIDEGNVTTNEFKHTLEQTNFIQVLDDPINQVYPTPRMAADKEEVFVGRIRRDLTNDKGFHFWVVTDNLLKGAALNSVQIAETLLTNKLI